MATIKSFTTLEQSKKLAEILSLETADMHYGEYCASGENYPIPNCDDDYNGQCCWSLAALIDVLPQFIEFKGDKYYLRFMKEYVEYANDEVSITGRCLHTTGNDNLVDACVEMIIKLHELKML